MCPVHLLLCSASITFFHIFSETTNCMFSLPPLLFLILSSMSSFIIYMPPLFLSIALTLYSSSMGSFICFLLISSLSPIGAVISPGNPFFKKNQNNLGLIQVTNSKGGFTPIQAIYGLQNPGTYIYCFFAISVDPHFGVNMTA